VATGKAVKPRSALRILAWGRYFAATRCADEGFPKPHPDMLLRLMDQVGADPGATLMIGDTTHDLEMARSAGVAAVAAGYGAHPRARLEAQEPLACVTSFRELARWITENA
jgi:phosphoglycolate phosphatase